LIPRNSRAAEIWIVP